ncbi:phosphotransferase [Arthrobacter sp. TMS2-4]
MGMHDDQLYIDEDIARRLIVDQFPRWRAEPVRYLNTHGTVNAIVRIGTSFAARFPLRAADPDETCAQISREADAMRELAAHCPFPSPTPLAVGAPGAGYPLPWSVQTWLPGAAATPEGSADSDRFARDLALLIQSLRAAGTRGRTFSGSGRGGDLKDSDQWLEVCFRESEGLLPVGRLRDLWAVFRRLPAGTSTAMTHGDLIPGNMLVDGDRLIGVLDGGAFAAADPALDLVAGWHLLDRRRRQLLRDDLAIDDREWWRGAAWAFQQAMGLVWYYRETNPAMSDLGRITLARITGDPDFSSHALASTRILWPGALRRPPGELR